MSRKPFALLTVLLLAFAAAALGACGSTAKLLPADTATRLDDKLQAASDALSAGDCARAEQAVADAQGIFAALPTAVDARLRARLGEGLASVARTVPQQCDAGATPSPPPTTSTGTTATTGPTTTETTATQPPTTDTTPPPTDTTPTTPTTTPTPTSTTPAPPTGGVSPDGGTTTGKTP